jgi:hypothetical protein
METLETVLGRRAPHFVRIFVSQFGFSEERAEQFVSLAPAFDRKGRIAHDGGVVKAVPGLYTLGHTFLRSRKSSFMYGVGEDTRHVASDIARHLAGACREAVAVGA